MSSNRHSARFEALAEQLRPVLRAALRGLCRPGTGVDPDDVQQEALLRLWRAVEAEREIHQPASYLWRAVSSAVCDARRRVAARREEPLESGAEQEAPREWTAPGATPERIAAQREVLHATDEFLQGLDDQHGRAVKLHLQGFSTQEIADLLGFSEPKARNIVYRAMGALRQELEQRGLQP